MIGDKMEINIDSLPDGFYSAISSPIKTMYVPKNQVKGDKARLVIDLESIFFGY